MTLQPRPRVHVRHVSYRHLQRPILRIWAHCHTIHKRTTVAIWSPISSIHRRKRGRTVHQQHTAEYGAKRVVAWWVEPLKVNRKREQKVFPARDRKRRRVGPQRTVGWVFSRARHDGSLCETLYDDLGGHGVRTALDVSRMAPLNWLVVGVWLFGIMKKNSLLHRQQRKWMK